MDQDHEGVDAGLHRVRGKEVGLAHQRLHPLRRMHQRMVRMGQGAHGQCQERRLGEVVQGAQTRLRPDRSRSREDQERRIREPGLRPSQGTAQDRLLALPQRRRRRRHPRLRIRRAQGHSEDEGDRNLLRLLLHERRLAGIIRASRLRARLCLARHRLLRLSGQLLRPSDGRRLRQPDRPLHRKALRQAPPSRDRRRSAHAEVLEARHLEDIRGGYCRQHARGCIRNGERMLLLLVRHVGRGKRLLRRSRHPPAHREARRYNTPLQRRLSASRRRGPSRLRPGEHLPPQRERPEGARVRGVLPQRAVKDGHPVRRVHALRPQDARHLEDEGGGLSGGYKHHAGEEGADGEDHVPRRQDGGVVLRARHIQRQKARREAREGVRRRSLRDARREHHEDGGWLDERVCARLQALHACKAARGHRGVWCARMGVEAVRRVRERAFPRGPHEGGRRDQGVPAAQVRARHGSP